jgi:hypothetical protein
VQSVLFGCNNHRLVSVEEGLVREAEGHDCGVLERHAEEGEGGGCDDEEGKGYASLQFRPEYVHVGCELQLRAEQQELCVLSLMGVQASLLPAGV